MYRLASNSIATAAIVVARLVDMMGMGKGMMVVNMTD